MSYADVPYSEITPSRDNPRKVFDPEAMERLADSIAAQGINQTLLLARGEKGYIIAAGERRHRAFGLLVKRGLRKASDTLPALIVDRDKVVNLEQAMVENLQRESLHPMDEAEGYAQLRDLGKTAAAISRDLGIEERHVQLRLNLNDHLGAPAKKAFRANHINLGMARYLAAYADKGAQPKWLKAISADPDSTDDFAWISTAEDLKRALKANAIPIKQALFDVAQAADTIRDEATVDPEIQATGPVQREVEPPAQPPADTKTPAGKAKPEKPAPVYSGEAVFTDPARFAELQTQALEERIADLKSRFADVWVVRDLNYLPHFDRERGNMDYDVSKDDDAGALVYVTKQLEVAIHEGVKPAKRQGAGGTKKAKKKKADGDKPAPTREACLPREKGLALAKVGKTHALQAAIIQEHPQFSMVFTIMGLLGSSLISEKLADGPVYIGFQAIMISSGDRKSVRDRVYTPEYEAEAERFARIIKPALGSSKAYTRSLDDCKLFDILTGLSAQDLGALFSHLVAGQVGTWASNLATLGDDALTIHIAKTLGVKSAAQGGQVIDLPLLDSLGLEGLRALARDIGMMKEYMTTERLFKLRLGDLKAAILDYAEANKDALTKLPPAFTFGTKEELTQAYPVPPAPPAKPKKAPAEKKPAAKKKAAAPKKPAAKGKGKAADVGKSTAKGKAAAAGGLKVTKEVTLEEAKANQKAKAAPAKKAPAKAAAAKKAPAARRFASQAKG